MEMDFMDELDNELFINEVRKYPEIWNMGCEEYKDRYKREAAWSAVGEAMVEGFCGKDKKEMKEIVRKLIGKWRNIRDAYSKSEKKRTSSIPAPRGRKYMYSRQLSFLQHLFHNPVPERLQVCEARCSADESQSQTFSHGSEADLSEFGDWNEALQPVTTLTVSPAASATPVTNNKRRKCNTLTTEQEIQPPNANSSITLDSFKSPTEARSDLDIFGELVSATLKEIKNKKLVFKGKKQISDILFTLQEEDLQDEDSL